MKTGPYLPGVGLWACTAVFLYASGAYLDRIGTPQIDVFVLSHFDRWRAPLLDLLFASITWLGSLYILVPVTLGWVLVARGKVGRRAASFVFVSLVATALMARIVKVAVGRSRPDIFDPLVAMPLDASFPSAHTMQALAVAFALFALPLGSMCSRPLAAATMVAAALVSLSRLYLQVHFPTDVAAAAIGAFACVCAVRTLPAFRTSAHEK